MKHVMRVLAIAAAAAMALVIPPAAASASAPTPAGKTCPGAPLLTMEHENAAGEVVAVSTMTFVNPTFGEAHHCAFTQKTGSSVGVAHEITLKIAWGVGRSEEWTDVWTDGGPAVSLEWLQHCTGITVTMRDLDGTLVFQDQSPFIHCPV